MSTLVLGETRTCLLRNSGAAARHAVERILELLPGERVRTAQRPIEYAVSPELVTGVDCPLPTASGARYRVVGTVGLRGVVVGGRVLQGSSYARIMPGSENRRLSWGHYLARPGVVESIGRCETADVAEGHLAGHAVGPSMPALDLGAVSERLIGRVQMSPALDHATPFRSRRTRLRWAVTLGDDGTTRAGAELTLVDDFTRTLRLRVPDDDLASVVAFCEDVALHDWILTTLIRIVERCELDTMASSAAIGRLRPAVDHLLHLWMPGAHIDEGLLPLWDGLERRPGFSRQWQTVVTRIRDQLLLYTLTALGKPVLNGNEKR